MKNTDFFEKLKEIGIVPVISLEDAASAEPLAAALIAGGIPCAEVTFRTSAAQQAIRNMTAAFPDMLVGAGTVMTVEQADAAVIAGAKFIVSPCFDEKVVNWCISKGIPILPGCVTPTEMTKAMQSGLSAVKFFPAENSGGVKYLKAVSAPLSGLKFIPTGGINASNLKDYLSFDKVIACGGSWMINKELIAAGDYAGIAALCRHAVNSLHDTPAVAEKPSVENNFRKIVTFGELMLRLAPPGYLRFAQTDSFEATYGGGEANVAVSLANYGDDTLYVTKLPENELGHAARNSLRRWGVDCSKIVFGGSRLGIYYLEKGASQRASKVIYDRAGSSIATAKPSDFDWDSIFDGAGWFHFTGITPALGGYLPEICEDACKSAKRKGVKISCDLNYRKNLWTREQACKVMTKLIRYADLCIANEDDMKDVFGISADKSNTSTGILDQSGYVQAAKTLSERFSVPQVAVTLRGSISASDNTWGAMLLSNGEPIFSKTYNVHIIDRVGGGDSFAGGLIHSLCAKKSDSEALEFATAASCLKHSIEGDYNLVSTAEVEKLASGDASGRVVR